MGLDTHSRSFPNINQCPLADEEGNSEKCLGSDVGFEWGICGWERQHIKHADTLGYSEVIVAYRGRYLATIPVM